MAEGPVAASQNHRPSCGWSLFVVGKPKRTQPIFTAKESRARFRGEGGSTEDGTGNRVKKNRFRPQVERTHHNDDCNPFNEEMVKEGTHRN